MTTLLEKAVATPVRQYNETVGLDELSIAWMKGSVSATQVATALEIPIKHRASIYNRLAQGLRQAYRNGKLKIAEESK